MLRERGDQVDCEYEPNAARQLLILLKATRYHGVFIQRKLFSIGFVRLLKRCAHRIFFDFDDAIFLRSTGEPSKTRGKKFDTIVTAADAVFAGNSYLQRAASKHNGSVYLTPTCVEVDRYAPPAPANPETEDNPFTLVWIGSRSTSRYLQQHLSALNAIGESFPQVRLKIIADFSLAAEHLNIDLVPWRAESEISELQSADVGIAPMSDDPWTRGKCALKVIQYMAAGLPVVSSKVGANEDVVVQGETGFLVASDAQWVEAVGRLIASRQLRDDMGRQAIARAHEHFDLMTTAKKIIKKMDEHYGQADPL